MSQGVLTVANSVGIHVGTIYLLSLPLGNILFDATCYTQDSPPQRVTVRVDSESDLSC